MFFVLLISTPLWQSVPCSHSGMMGAHGGWLREIVPFFEPPNRFLPDTRASASSGKGWRNFILCRLLLDQKSNSECSQTDQCSPYSSSNIFLRWNKDLAVAWSRWRKS